MHWTERRSARANLCHALRNAGWFIYGYKEDQSDMMTDYYSPPDWNGVATKEGYTLVVDAGKYTTETYSGKEIFDTEHDQGNCLVCSGSGFEPSGWTLTKARENPQQFNNEWAEKHFPGRKVMSLSASVISPLHFKGEHEKCRGCKGTGQIVLNIRKVYKFTWPTFQVNPPHRVWHIEKDGKIIASGTGLGKCSVCNSHMEPYKSEQANHISSLIAKFHLAIAKDKGQSQTQPSRTSALTDDMTFKPSPGLKLDNYKGHPILSLPGFCGKPFSFGLSKARLIVKYFEDIRKFVKIGG